MTGLLAAAGLLLASGVWLVWGNGVGARLGISRPTWCPDWIAPALVWGGWLVLLLSSLAFVGTFAQNPPYWDDWSNVVPYASGSRPADLAYLWAQDVEHRYPLTKAVVLGVIQLGGLDFVRPPCSGFSRWRDGVCIDTSRQASPGKNPLQRPVLPARAASVGLSRTAGRELGKHGLLLTQPRRLSVDDHCVRERDTPDDKYGDRRRSGAGALAALQCGGDPSTFLFSHCGWVIRRSGCCVHRRLPKNEQGA